MSALKLDSDGALDSHNTMSTTASLLEVRDIRTTFRTPNGNIKAVDGVSFDLERGRTLGIVGESGSGKSVLVRSIMGLLGPSATVEGEVLMEGRDVRTLGRLEAKHFWGIEIAMVFQDPMTSLNPVKKIGTSITETLRFHLGLSRGAARRRAIELLEQVGLPAPERRLDDYPHQLSGGMRQRVTIAMALSCDPKLLICDEPTTALDVTVQKQILDLLGQLQRERHMAMILITHDLGVVSGRTDDVMVMYAGRAVETAPTPVLFESVRHQYTAALLRSIPRVEDPSHTRLDAILGRPPDLRALPPGCRFSPRCPASQQRCIDEMPILVPMQDEGHHRAACFFPVGTPEGDAALAANLTMSDRNEETSVPIRSGGPTDD